MNTAPWFTRHPLLRILRSPGDVAQLSVPELEELICQARQERLGGHLWHVLEANSLLQSLHPVVRRQLWSGFLEAEYHRQRILWEADRIHWALRDLGLSIILLKGGAYAAANLDIAKGRFVRDLDVLLPKECLSAAEKTLIEAGWEHVVLDDYDQRYYRLWSHELPPLVHPDRRTELDLHHAIVPRSSYRRLDMLSLHASAIVIDTRGTKVLAPLDMTLHCAAHLFQTGEIRGGLRDLVDFAALVRQFSSQPAFQENLVPRALQLGLGRPLYYALRYATRLLNAGIPEPLMHASEAARPSPLVLAFMDFAIPQALLRSSAHNESWLVRFGHVSLYIRSHWLRMPPLPLAMHIARKSLRRWKFRESNA